MSIKKLTSMKVNEIDTGYTPVDYDNLHSYRTKIRRKHPEMNWQIKLGNGLLTVKRTS